MTARQIRRAEEQRARKLAYKNRTLSVSEGQAELSEPPAATPAPLSEARLAANRANSQLSTGPQSPEGKSKVSLNALKTALTGRTVLLPSDDVEAYRQHLSSYEKEFKPVGSLECSLVQSLADTDWRLHRITGLEFAIFARGHCQFVDRFRDADPALQSGLIDAEIFLVYEKQLRNLQLQESRLLRHREKALVEFRHLQQEREARRQRDLEAAATLYTAASQDGKPFHPADHGFEFSIAEIESYLERIQAARAARKALRQSLDPAFGLSAAA